MFRQYLKERSLEEIKALIREYKSHMNISLSKNGKAKKKDDLINEIVELADFVDGKIVVKGKTFEKLFDVDKLNNILKKKPHMLNYLKNLAEK